MIFKVDELPTTADDLCPFEDVCCNAHSSDCPKYWSDERREDMEYIGQICEMLVVE